MKKQLKKIIAIAGLVVLSTAGTSFATLLDFNFDGESVTGVGSLDHTPGTAYALGGNQTGSFTLYYQSTLSAFTNEFGIPIGSTGLNSNYEITMVAGFGETGTITPNGTGGASIALGFDSTNPVNFVQMYYDTARNANPLAGTGFTDGALILSGYVYGFDGPASFSSNDSLSTQDPSLFQRLDGFLADNWDGQRTVTGTGGTNLLIAVDFINTAILLNDIDLLELSFNLFTNTSNNLPFRQIDPSKQIYLGGDVNNPANYLNTVGTLGQVNGSLVYGSPNLMFQADANTSAEVVPEPSTFVLAGMGLLFVAGLARRRKA